MPALETKWIVSAAAVGTLLFRRDVETASCMVGALCNAFAAKILKRLFNAARPNGAVLSDPGMPSSHAQSLFFFASYLSLVARERLPQLSHASPRSLSIAMPTGIFAVAGYLAYLRVHAGLHTPAQVIAGGCFGATAGAGWLRVVQPQLVYWASVRTHSSTWLVTAALVLSLGAMGAQALGVVDRIMTGKWSKKNR